MNAVLTRPPVFGPGRVFPLRSRTEAALTLVVYPIAWALYIGSTPWRSLEDAVSVPIFVLALYGLSEVAVQWLRTRGWERLQRDPAFLGWVLRPCAVGYMIANACAVLIGVCRFVVYVASRALV